MTQKLRELDSQVCNLKFFIYNFHFHNISLGRVLMIASHVLEKVHCLHQVKS